jgi:Domain of unknown function (DUF4349)
MRTIRPAIPMLFLLALLLSACGSGGSAAPALSGVGAPIGGGADEGEQPAAPSAAPSAAPGEGEGDGVGAPIDDARIVRTGTIELEVDDVATALTKARDGIRAMDGYIGASETATSDETPVAYVTYRVPVDRWEAALDLLRGISGPGTKVLSERTEAVEVTGQVVDLEARIRNLRASETALQGIAEQAIRVSDVLEVQAQLTIVRGEIEQLTAQLQDLEDRADYATLSATFAAPVVAVDVAQADWDPARTVDEATASLVDLLQALAGAGIWFAIVWLPILVFLGLIAAIGAWFLRRIGVIGPRRKQGEEAVPS